MARQIISGTPGETWTNNTGKARYQLVVSWQNSCGVCIQSDGLIGPSWPIPFHVNCRCKQLFLPPGGESQPFVDFTAKIQTLDPSQRGKVIGASNLKLIEAGKADWSDVVTEGRVRDLREVVRAGIDRRTAEEAYSSVHTAAHELARQSRDRILKALRDRGLSDDQIKKAVAERLAGRVRIGGGPSGPQGSPVKPGPVPTPLPPSVLGKVLGVKLKPVPKPDPLAPLRDWKPAGTVGGATEFMRTHLGVDRVDTDVPGWVRERFPDDAPLPEAELADHLDAVNGEWARLRVEYPGLPERPVSTFIAIHSKRGFATIPDKNPPGAKNDLAAKAKEWADRVWDGTAAWDKRSGNRSTSERRGTQVLDNFRHELGHALTTTAVRENFVKAAAAADAKSLEWFRGHVSEYAATDVYEAIAESFGVYTRADYPKGKGEAAGGLAPWLETFFEDLLGK